MYAYIKT